MKKFHYVSIFVCISFIAMLVISGLTKAANAQAGGTSAAEMNSSEGQKDEYKKTTKRKLSGFEKDIKEIEAKSRETGARAKADIQKGIEELKEKHQAAKGEMKKLDAAGKETWKNVKEDLDKAMDELEKTFDKVRSYFK
jgi:membrane-associated HD superfamily phosphohydrolase